jgi:6-phosphogluconate dehydrogenase
MQIGLIGLGKMGYPLALNLQRQGHQVMAWDLSPDTLARLASEGIKGTSTLEELVSQLSTRRILWLMVPAGEAVDTLLNGLAPLLNPGDILIDGGNSFYKDSMRRHQEMASCGLHYLDCGTSGGISGALYGACTMIGGDRDVFELCEPIFRSISVDKGCLYCGPSGSGHFIKMVHNGIEYGMMQAIAEGFEVLEKADFSFDLHAIAQVWNHGSVVRSWLMELTANAFSKEPHLENLRGVMHSSGEGKWTLETALDLGISTPVIALSLLMRYRSQDEDSFAGKVVAALRNEFGGHKVETR